MGKESDKGVEKQKEGDSSVKEAPKELADIDVQKEAVVTQKGSLREAAKAFLDKGTMGGFLEKGKASAPFELYDSSKPAPPGDQKQAEASEKGKEKTDAPGSKYQKETETLVDRFEKGAGKTPPNLTDAIVSINGQAEKMTPEEFKEYIKEANKALHDAGLLPKGVNLDDDKNRYPSHIQGSDPELPVETADGKVASVLDAEGHDIGDAAAIPDLFDSRREKRAEAKAESAKEIKEAGEKYFDAMDKDGDKRISKEELDQFIKDAQAGKAKMPDGSPVDDQEAAATHAQTIRDNFGKIERASNDDRFFEKGISRKDLSDYAEKRTEKFEEKKAEAREKDAEKVVDLFKEALAKKDLSKVIDEVAKKQAEMSKDEYAAYIKEVNKQLHDAGLLPKDRNIDDGSKADDLADLESLYSTPVLAITDADNKLIGAVDARGENRYNGKEAVADPLDFGQSEAKPETKAEAKPEAKPEAPASKPADAPKKPEPPDDILDKKGLGILDPFADKHSEKEVWVEVGPQDNPQKTLDKFAEAALKRANGSDYKPSKEEIAKQAAEIIKDNPDAFPGGKLPKKFPPETEVSVEIPKPRPKANPSLD